MKIIQLVVTPLVDETFGHKKYMIHGLGNDNAVYRAEGTRWMMEIEPPAKTKWEEAEERKRAVAVAVEGTPSPSPIYTPPPLSRDNLPGLKPGR